jgi:hypothetical protein
MKVQPIIKEIANGVVSMRLFSDKKLESVTTLIKQFNYEEMRTCFESAMSLSKLDTFVTSEENFFRTLRTDFEVIGNILSGSREHYSLMKKINLLTKSERELLVFISLQHLYGEEGMTLQIGQLVNDNCHSVDLW